MSQKKSRLKGARERGGGRGKIWELGSVKYAEAVARGANAPTCSVCRGMHVSYEGHRGLVMAYISHRPLSFSLFLLESHLD